MTARDRRQLSPPVPKAWSIEALDSHRVRATAVRPGNVRAAEYDHDSHALTVVFANASYEYDAVPPETWRDLVRSPGGPGKAVNRLIVNGGFAYRKLAKVEASG